MVVFCSISFRFLHRIFPFVLLHLAIDNFVLIQAKLIEHVSAIYDDISQLFADMINVIVIIIPLETFEQFKGFNGYGLGQVRGRMELIPVPV